MTERIKTSKGPKKGNQKQKRSPMTEGVKTSKGPK
jgi:hypothetical protein